MVDEVTLSELDARIAAVQENLRTLVEQAAAYSGSADEERTAQRIADQEEKLEVLQKRREAVLAGSGGS